MRLDEQLLGNQHHALIRNGYASSTLRIALARIHIFWLLAVKA